MEEITEQDKSKMEFVEELTQNLKENNGKISFEFIKKYADTAEKLYLNPTPSMRLCILKLTTGHEVIGVAQVLDAKNDVEEIGNSVAYDNAIDKLWSTFGSIAKVLN